MKGNYSSKIVKSILMTVFLSLTLSSHAQTWEMINALPATNAFHVTKSGNLLMADYLFEMNGGIYVSTDKGQNWEKTAVEDFNYNYFVENEKYVFAAGAATNIARSADEGLTWELVGYSDAVIDQLGYEIEYTV